ncbi:carbohydrate-binding module family 14 protein [Nostoc sp. WHI]|uniref:carbohydrate-binding module family 14 protein n=1 Tax=Nostoc sp. WHI TaxID=2650611 RepID=UPI0018C5D697|nr:carbohydrate-binding module family 14 protein [Nostoc sp. WHI]
MTFAFVTPPAFASVSPWDEPRREPIDNINYYDCSNKPDGNYKNPNDVTRFIMCNDGRAADVPCANCTQDDSRCSGSEYLYWDDSKKVCEYPIYVL